ncbi:MAG: hypothetical protein EBQ82_10800 [Betaproteobacteria bacterium]|nr:hypothetical protein [Betaproteobacteria bacterium]NBY05853.1 hypothetical protein [Betaproteobacteria bacterium]
MNLAIWGVIQMMSPFYQLTTPSPSPVSRQTAKPFRSAPKLIVAAAKPPKPLRMARVRDSQTGPDQAGRMVISGRMDEVCAELDRLIKLDSLRQNKRTETQLAA